MDNGNQSVGINPMRPADRGIEILRGRTVAVGGQDEQLPREAVLPRHHGPTDVHAHQLIAGWLTSSTIPVSDIMHLRWRYTVYIIDNL